MNDENYWQQFMASGKVEDYLRYARLKEANETSKETLGEDPYAGLVFRDRDGVEPDSYR